MNAHILSLHADNDVSALRAHDLPTLAQLDGKLYGACFTVMKLLAARAAIEDGVETGKIKEGTRVVESTSGTFGLALAMLRPYYGYELTLVSDPVIDPMLRMRLEQLGATLEIVESPQDGSYQVARLARVQEILARNPGTYFTNQYHSPVNAKGYARLADYLAARFPRIDYLVGTVGTGGSMCGTATHLRRHFPHLKVIGIDTHNSVVFGQPNGPRQLRGLGNSLIPGNVDHTQFDQVHWVSAAEAYRSARDLQRTQGLFMGGTSGAAYKVSKWIAEENPKAITVALFPDEGYRYLDTVYSDTYVKTLPGWNDPQTDEPELLLHPTQVTGRWSYLNWNRRTLQHVLYGTPTGHVATR